MPRKALPRAADASNLQAVAFLPIAERELRVAARKRGTFWLRLFAAMVASLVGGCFILLASTQAISIGPTQAGALFFALLAGLCLAAALASGLFLTSDCLSEEKRDGTLGLLFLTDLKSYDVVVGKLLGSSLLGFYGLLATFPILAIPLLLGGVTWEAFWKVVLALLNALWLSLACGMFISSVSRHAHRALTGTMTLLVLLAVAGPTLDSLIAHLRGTGFEPMFSYSSPIYVFRSAWSSFASAYWLGLGLNQATALLLWVLTFLILPRAWQEKVHGPSSKVVRGVMQVRRTRSPANQRWLERNPLQWLAGHGRWQPLPLWILAGLMFLSKVWLVLSGTPSTLWMASSYLEGFIILLIYISITSRACRFMVDAKRSGLLELLLVTPIPYTEVPREIWRAHVRRFAGPVLAILATQGFGDVMRILAMFSQVSTVIVQNPLATRTAMVAGGVVGLLGILITLVNLAALVWHGMWMGLTTSKATLATLKSLVFVQVLPWLAIAFATNLIVALTAVSSFAGSGGAASTVRFIMLYTLASGVVAFLLTLFKDVIFIRWARGKFDAGFRERVWDIPGSDGGRINPSPRAPIG